MEQKQPPSYVQQNYQSHDNLSTILAARGAKYGDFTDHAKITQDLKKVMQTANVTKWNKLRPIHKEALEMIQHKVARIINGDPDYPDNWDDIAGYAKLVADRTHKLQALTLPEAAPPVKIPDVTLTQTDQPNDGQYIGVARAQGLPQNGDQQ